jgi:hypothetical protein
MVLVLVLMIALLLLVLLLHIHQRVAFGGDKSLKFFQQWVAASIAGRQAMSYFTFGETYNGHDLAPLIARCNEIARTHQLVAGTRFSLSLSLSRSLTDC